MALLGSLALAPHISHAAARVVEVGDGNIVRPEVKDDGAPTCCTTHQLFEGLLRERSDPPVETFSLVAVRKKLAPEFNGDMLHWHIGEEYVLAELSFTERVARYKQPVVKSSVPLGLDLSSMQTTMATTSESVDAGVTVENDDDGEEGPDEKNHDADEVVLPPGAEVCL